jgi:DNA helicase-2/ATP-dependent DNA helicase PcrA
MKPDINIFDSFKNAMAESGEETAGGRQESANPAVKLGYCRHKVFGRGKIIEEVDSEKVRVNFTGIGLKVIMKAYLTFED